MSEVIDPIFELIKEDETIFEVIPVRGSFKKFLSVRKSCCGVMKWDYPEILENKDQHFVAIRFSKIIKVKPEFSWEGERKERLVLLVADVTYEKAVARAIEWSKQFKD